MCNTCSAFSICSIYTFTTLLHNLFTLQLQLRFIIAHLATTAVTCLQVYIVYFILYFILYSSVINVKVYIIKKQEEKMLRYFESQQCQYYRNHWLLTYNIFQQAMQ